MPSTTLTATDRVRKVDPRTCALRDRVRRFEDDPHPFLRGLIATRVYRDLADLPTVLKRAEIHARTLEQLTPIVLPEDRLVGPTWRRFRVHYGVSDPDGWRLPVQHPEQKTNWTNAPLPADVRSEMEWWLVKGVKTARTRNDARERHKWLYDCGVAHPHGTLGGHTLPDHAILLDAGVGELRRRIAARLASPGSPQQRDEWRAMDRCLEGLTAFARNCATAARQAAAGAGDPTLAERLLAAANNCYAVATERPATFAQALQLLRFSHFADVTDCDGDASSLGRVDQYLLPFYQADLDHGALTEYDAFDLVCHFLLKTWCKQSSHSITVGGVRPDGSDSVNDLSWMFPEAMEALRMPTDMSARLHGGDSPEYRRMLARVVRRGMGRPSLWNDEVTIEALVRHGVEIEDARDYAPLGCAEVMIPGRTTGRTMGFGMNLMKVLELALNRGRCLVTGRTVWGDVPESFDSFDDLVARYHALVQRVVDAGIEIIREDERLEPQFHPRPWLTVLSRGGIEAGLDMTAGQPKYNPIGVTLEGLADVTNSLLAVRRIVFEDARLTLDELRGVLAADWEGHEPLRQYVLNRLPRFGMDDPEINEIARREAAHYAACFREHRTYYGGRFWPMIFGLITSMIGRAKQTGPTPSGRKAGHILAASLQPSPAGPRGGPTELFRAVAEIDFRDYPGGISNVQDIDPALVDGEDGLDRLTKIIDGFFDLGGMELGPNLMDAATLRAAQQRPDEHPHVMVRLFGLSAQFISLSRELQDRLIERMEAVRRQLTGGGA